MPEVPQQAVVKVRYRKTVTFWMTLGVILFLSVLALLNVGIFQDIENKAIDIRFGVRGARQPDAPIRILAIDEKSLKELGQWPWPRALHAELVRQLKADGVKCVSYDVFFPEPERTQQNLINQLGIALNSSIEGKSKAVDSIRAKVMADLERFQESQNGDKAFAQAMKDVDNVFLPLVTVNGDEGRSPNPESLHATPAQLVGGGNGAFLNAQSLIISIPELQNNVKDSGHIRFYPNQDGIYRAYPTVISYQDKLIPSLDLQTARYMLDDKEPIKVVDGKYVETAGRRIPILDNGFAFINYCGPRGSFKTISVSDVIKKRVDPAELKDTVVLVGYTAVGLFDLRPTPFTKATPGIEVRANMIENVMSGHFITLAPEYWKFILIVVLAFFMRFLVPRGTPTQVTLWLLLTMAGYFIVACAIFSYSSVVINMTYPMLSVLLTSLLLTTYKFATEVRHSRYLKQMFQSMVSPTVVEEILRLPAGIELGGEERELTVMFSDIRSFTTYSEKHTPKEVVAILNEYLTQMTNLLFQTEGTLDKYIGDAIMGFWGAPTNEKDHAYRAASTALGMVEMLHTVLHPKWDLEGKERLNIGIGLNTGPMVVGFVGSQSIKSYTLIGDAVNLGSRLEGTTKEYHVEIIVSETTYEQIKNDILCRELDLIRVKGKNKPIRIYELVDHRMKAAGMKEMKVKAFEEGLALYREQKWDEAMKCFKNCLELDPNDGPGGIFMERCVELKKNPPPKDWDGVFVMKTK